MRSLACVSSLRQQIVLATTLPSARQPKTPPSRRLRPNWLGLLFPPLVIPFFLLSSLVLFLLEVFSDGQAQLQLECDELRRARIGLAADVDRLRDALAAAEQQRVRVLFS